MNFKNLNAQGYVFLRSFNDIYLPSYIQNLLIKNFCDQKKMNFNLSINEHKIKNCWMELYSLIKKNNIDVIIMTSIYMLPETNKEFNFFCKLLKKKPKIFYFILENKNAKNLKDLKMLKKKFQLFKKLNDVV